MQGKYSTTKSHTPAAWLASPLFVFHFFFILCQITSGYNLDNVDSYTIETLSLGMFLRKFQQLLISWTAQVSSEFS